MRRLFVALALLFSSRAEAVSVAPHLLGSLKGANLNSTSDQAIAIPDAALGSYYIDAIRVTGSTCVGTTAAGGIYTTTSKGGTAVVANTQVYTALAGNAVDTQVLTLAVTNKAWTVSTLYLSLTTAKGSACVANLYIYGDVFPALAAEPSITAPLRFQVSQRSGTTGSVTISGALNTYDNAGPWLIEARLAGGAYQTVASAATSGAFSGSVTFDQGQGTLDVRASQGGVVSNLRSVADIGVGDVFVLLGQSNADGRGTSNQTWSHASLKATMYGKQYTWKQLVDPVGSGIGGLDPLHQDPFAGGSVWPRVAEKLMTDRGVPVAFVPAAVGATAILQWLPPADHADRSTLYGAAKYRASLVGGCRAALWWQGEWDAGPLGDTPTPQATYNTRLDTIANAWVADTGCKIMPAKLHNSSGLSDVNEAAINAAIGDAWADNSNVLTGPDLTSITSDDAFHPTSNTKLQAAADLWVTAIETALP